MSDILTCPFEIKAVSDEGSFSGYGSVFGNLDRGRDRVAPGAFKRTLKEHAARNKLPKMLWSHDATRPPIGEWKSMGEDAHGLMVEGRLFMSNPFARDEVYPALKAGAIDQMSIGYSTKQEKWDSEEKSRTLLDVDLWEVSPVVFAMNPEAQVARVKAMNDAEMARAVAKCGAMKAVCGSCKDCGSRDEMMSGMDSLMQMMGSPKSHDPRNIRELEAILRDAGLSRSEAKALLAEGFKSLRDAEEPEDEKARNALRDAEAVDGKSLLESMRAFRAAIHPK